MLGDFLYFNILSLCLYFIELPLLLQLTYASVLPPNPIVEVMVKSSIGKIGAQLSGIAFDRMMFFDDLDFNIREISALVFIVTWSAMALTFGCCVLLCIVSLKITTDFQGNFIQSINYQYLLPFVLFRRL